MKRLDRMVLLGTLVAATAAVAWDHEYLWYDAVANTSSPSGQPGGGGVMGTGGLRDGKVSCQSCHYPVPFSGARVTTGVSFNPSLSTLPDGGKQYALGQAYTVTVTMTGEHVFNPDGGLSRNGFAGSFEPTGSAGNVGQLDSDTAGFTHSPCQQRSALSSLPDAGTTIVYSDCHTVIGRDTPGLTSWTFTWTAPSNAPSPVTFFWGVVDGVGNNRSQKGDGGINDDSRLGTFTMD